jgi:hypothetical protein
MTDQVSIVKTKGNVFLELFKTEVSQFCDCTEEAYWRAFNTR